MKTSKQNGNLKAVLANLSRGFSNDFCDFSWEENFSCDEIDTGYCDEKSCRCLKISNIEVEELYTDKVLNFISMNIENKYIKYAIDRIFRSLKLYDPKYWEIQIVDGFYGQEPGNLFMTQSGQDLLIKEISLLKGFDDFEVIKQALFLEYGFLPPEVEKSNSVDIKLVKLSDIIINNKNHYEKVKSEHFKIYKYQKSKIPYAIVFKKGKQYFLIDGYHRLVSVDKNHQGNVLVIEKKRKQSKIKK